MCLLEKFKSPLPQKGNHLIIGYYGTKHGAYVVTRDCNGKSDIVKLNSNYNAKNVSRLVGKEIKMELVADVI